MDAETTPATTPAEPQTPPAVALCAMLTTKVHEHFAAEHGFGRHASTRAGALPFGGIGRGCDRYHYLNRTVDPPKQADVRGRQRMRVGRVLEKDAGRLLEDAGLDVHRLPYKLRDENRDIAGAIDYALADPNTGLFAPVEVKSLTPYVFDTIRPGNLGDVLRCKSWWVRSYVGQLLVYLMLPPDSRQADYGVLVLVSIDGRYNFIPVSLFDAELVTWAEEMLDRAARVKEAMRTQMMPDRLPQYDEEVCGHCAWADTHCWTDVVRPGGDVLALLEDDEFTAACRAVLEHRDAHEKFEEANELVKTRIAVTEPDAKKMVLAAADGTFVVKRTRIERKGYTTKPKDVPPGHHYITKIEKVGAPALDAGVPNADE